MERMEDIDGFEARGERARLFPVLAESSKEGADALHRSGYASAGSGVRGRAC